MNKIMEEKCDAYELQTGKHMQQLLKKIREKKPDLDKERKKTLIKQRCVAELDPKQVPNRKKHH